MTTNADPFEAEITRREAIQREIEACEGPEFQANAQAAWDRQEPVNGVTPSDALAYFMDPTGMFRSGTFAALSADSTRKWAAVFADEPAPPRRPWWRPWWLFWWLFW